MIKPENKRQKKKKNKQNHPTQTSFVTMSNYADGILIEQAL